MAHESLERHETPPHESEPRRGAVDRRAVLRVGAAGCALVPLAATAACADDEVSSTGGASGEIIADTDEVPLGGGLIVSEVKVVLTQPSAGEYRAFSAVCTHQGCLVTRIGTAGGEPAIECACHGSYFALSDGAVLDGPAQEPLPAVEITVDGTEIAFA